MPDGRSMEYAIWRACERFSVRPPDVKDTWEDCNVMVQAALLSYDQIRQIEDTKFQAALAGAKVM